MNKSVSWVLGLALLLGILGIVGWKGYEWVQDRMTRERCYVPVDGESEPLQLTAEQAKNAAVIVAASYKAKLPERAAVVALATAWQESGLRNLEYGDRDSLGLFQQRPSQDWGTPEQIMDPWYSAGRFYEELVKFDSWESVDVNDMAQKVQRSGHPEAYRKHEANATALAGALRGSRPASLACIDRQEGEANAKALADVVAAVPGVTSSFEGSTVTLTASEPSALWAATHLALANTRPAGIVSAKVGEKEWSGGNATTWGVAKQPGPANKATLTLRD